MINHLPFPPMQPWGKLSNFLSWANGIGNE